MSDADQERDEKDAREEGLRLVWNTDAPQGDAWKCPNCDSWATIGGNAAYHATKTGHGVPELGTMPPEILPMPEVGDRVFYWFGANPNGKPEVRRRPAMVTSVRGETLNLFVFYEHCDGEHKTKYPQAEGVLEGGAADLLTHDEQSGTVRILGAQRWSRR